MSMNVDICINQYSNTTSAPSDPVTTTTTTTTFALRYWLPTAPATGRCARKPLKDAESTRSLALPHVCLSVCLRHGVASSRVESLTRSGTYHRASLHSTLLHLTSQPKPQTRKNRVKQAEKTGYYTTERVFTDGFNLCLSSPQLPQLSLSPYLLHSLFSLLFNTPSPSFPPTKKPTRTQTPIVCLPSTIVMTRPTMRGWLYYTSRPTHTPLLTAPSSLSTPSH
jgi:hypothetical protein